MVDLSAASNKAPGTIEDVDGSSSSQRVAEDVDSRAKLNVGEQQQQQHKQTEEEPICEGENNDDENLNTMSLDVVGPDTEGGRIKETEQTPQPQTNIESNSTVTGNNSLAFSAVTAEDARDEEADTYEDGRYPADDPYTYSDDSASLSDAYFFPQSDDDLARPPRYRNEETEPLKGKGNPQAPQQQYPLASYYGSIGSEHNTATAPGIGNPYHMNYPYINSHPGLQNPADQMTNSPLWLTAGSIQEDSEEIVTMYPRPGPFSPGDPQSAVQSLMAADARMNGGSRKERRRQRRQKRGVLQQQQKIQQKQREKQINRERAVNRIRGRPQDGKAKDVLWAVIFITQLIAVCVCAGHFGSRLFKEDSAMGWTKYVPNPAARSHFHHWNGDTNSRRGNKASQANQNQDGDIHVLPVLVHNDTTNELQYNEKLLKNETAKTAAVGKTTSTLTTKDVVNSLNAEVTGTGTAQVPADESFTIDYQNVVALMSITGFYACVLSYLSFGFMLILARALIQIMLVFSILLALAWGVIGLTLDPYGVISILGFTALLLTLGHAMYHWQRIPFAATNLYTALCAMRCTADIVILGLGCLVVSFTWSVIWGVAFIGIVNQFNDVECDEKDACGPHVVYHHIPLYILLLFSYDWTNSVIKNIVRSTVASVVGTWWFYPGDIGYFCTSAVARPLLRSMTTSLGSICLGSLTNRPVQTLALLGKCCCLTVGSTESGCLISGDVCEPGRNGSKQKNLLTAAPSLTVEDGSVADSEVGVYRPFSGLNDRLQTFLRSCNRWSYTYIGMYGYSFSEAGSLALKLFETREWLDVVRQNLIHHVLMMASIVIGGSTGTFAVIVEETDGYDFTSFHKPIISAFIIGSVLGYVLSNILLLGVVGSAVNTILVCFAAGPFEFDKNHPRLSREMREVWSQQVWEPPV